MIFPLFKLDKNYWWHFTDRDTDKRYWRVIDSVKMPVWSERTWKSMGIGYSVRCGVISRHIYCTLVWWMGASIEIFVWHLFYASKHLQRFIPKRRSQKIPSPTLKSPTRAHKVKVNNESLGKLLCLMLQSTWENVRYKSLHNLNVFLIWIPRCFPNHRVLNYQQISFENTGPKK